MRTVLATLPLLALTACMTPYGNDPYGTSGYPPQGYPEPYPPQGYPPQGYPPQGYPQPSPDPYGYPQPAPAPGPYGYPAPPGASDYRASGTEPFWDVTIGSEITFNDRGTGQTIVQATPAVIHGIAGEIYRTQRLEVNIVHAACRDSMSDRSYPDTVQVYADGKLYRGCGGGTVAAAGDPLAPAPPATTAPAPMPMPPGVGRPAPPLDRTRWQVIAINGRPVPRNGEYSLEFDNGRLSARLGCNSLSSSFTQNGNTLDAGAIISTRMACGDMSWETQGSAVLDQAMQVNMLDPNRITLTGSAGSIEMVRR